MKIGLIDVDGHNACRDFDGGEPTDEQKDFARWVNNKAVFNSCSWQDYKRRKR